MRNLDSKLKEKNIFSLFTYDISKLDKSKRVRFVYTIKGRNDDEGLIKYYGGKFLAPACFLIPIKNENEIIDIFKTWKVKYKKMKIKIID